MQRAQAFPKAFPNVPDALRGVYSYAWFVGFLLAGAVYLLLMRSSARSLETSRR